MVLFAAVVGLCAVVVFAIVGVVGLVRAVVRGCRRPTVTLDEGVLGPKARADLASLAGRSGLDVPQLLVVPILGRPFPGHQPGSVGTRGYATIRLPLPWRPQPTVFLAESARSLSDEARRSLLAHELGHLDHFRRSRVTRIIPIARMVALLLLLAVMVWSVQVNLAPVFLVAFTLALLLLAGNVALIRRDEIRADLFAIDLTKDVPAAAELMHAYEQRRAQRPASTNRLARRLNRVMATHPTPEERLKAMRSRLST